MDYEIPPEGIRSTRRAGVYSRQPDGTIKWARVKFGLDADLSQVIGSLRADADCDDKRTAHDPAPPVDCGIPPEGLSSSRHVGALARGADGKLRPAAVTFGLDADLSQLIASLRSDSEFDDQWDSGSDLAVES